eukprot:jgi/Hompol1/3752/HPOL_006718-RA
MTVDKAATLRSFKSARSLSVAVTGVDITAEVTVRKAADTDGSDYGLLLSYSVASDDGSKPAVTESFDGTTAVLRLASSDASQALSSWFRSVSTKPKLHATIEIVLNESIQPGFSLAIETPKTSHITFASHFAASFGDMDLTVGRPVRGSSNTILFKNPLQSSTPAIDLQAPLSAQRLKCTTNTDSVRTRDLLADIIEIHTDTGSVQVAGAIVCQDKLDIDADTGTIEVTGNITAKSAVVVKADTGSVLLAHLITQKLKIRTDTGKIKTAAIDAHDIELKSDTGRIDVGTVEATNLTASTDTGSISLASLTTIEDSSVKSDTGSVTVGPIKGRSVNIRTDTGRVSVGSVLAESVKIRTDTGSISVNGTISAQSQTIKSGTGSVRYNSA